MKIDTRNWPELLQQTGDRLNDWMNSINPNDLILCVFGFSVVFVLRKLLAGGSVRATQSLLSQFSVTLSEEVTSQLEKASEILIVTFAVYLALQVFHPPELVGNFLYRGISSVAIIAVFGTWFQLSGPFASLLRSDKLSPVNVETDWIQRITQFAVLLFGLTSLLKVWQVDIAGALTGVGVLGAGLAIATQDLIRNLVAGMTNMSEKRFKTGDAIQVDGQFLGSVKRIDLRSTLVVGFDQIPRHIPNSDLSNSVVLNYSEMIHRRIMLNVPLLLTSTQEQVEAVRDGLQYYHQTCGDFDLSDDAPKYICVSNLGASSIDIFFYVRTTGPNYDQYLQVKERLTLEILNIVKGAGATLAYPTQTIRLDGDA